MNLNRSFWILCLGATLIPLAFIIWLTYNSGPPRGTMRFVTVSGPVTIVYKDSYSIPYINGTTRESVYFALGFSHAVDRLFSLYLHRATAYGRLSEVISILYF